MCRKWRNDLLENSDARMNPSVTPPVSSPDATPRIFWEFWLPLFALVFYGMILARYSAAYAAGSDSSGYLNSARLLSHGHLTMPMRLVPGLNPESLPPLTYVPLGFVPNADHATMTPTYPVGLPLLLMAMAQVAGWNLTPGLILVLHALLGVFLVYRMGCVAGLETGWAWLGALLLAASPLYVMMSIQLMSDVPAMLWVTAAVLSAWQSRERPWLALGAGAALAVAVLVRPTNLLGFLPVGIALGFSLRRWLLLTAGGLPGAVFLGAVNYVAYGGIFTTGYEGLDRLFFIGNVPVTLVHYAIWLPGLLTPLILLALGLPVLRRRQLLLTTLLAAWALIFLIFYLFYYHTHETWWYLRFLLPAFPPLLVAALLVARRLAARLNLRPRAWWLALAAGAVLIHGGAWFRHFDLSSIGPNERLYRESAAWMQAHLPANSVVASMQNSGALLYYTGFTFIRWDLLPPVEFQRIAAACAAAGQPVYAALHPFEIDKMGAFRRHLTGRWAQVGSVRHVTIWRYDPSPVVP
jgi:4-amino-4-deoxy-L-arabinose transferase-like glycosyltransferase